jgi:hypothetical protein
VSLAFDAEKGCRHGRRLVLERGRPREKVEMKMKRQTTEDGERTRLA